MLLQFNFKNFKSFKDDTSLDMTATKISEYNNHVIKLEMKNPACCCHFGANAVANQMYWKHSGTCPGM